MAWIYLFIDPLRHRHGVIRALLAKFVLVPLLVFGIARLLSLDYPLEIGWKLISIAASAPFLIGYALGGRDLEIRGVLGLATGQHNISAAMVVATQDFDDFGVLVIVVISSLVGLALLFPAARIRRAMPGSAHCGRDLEPHRKRKLEPLLAISPAALLTRS